MQTAILFALVCLTGYTAGVTDVSKCLGNCISNGKDRIGRITHDGAVYILIEEKHLAVINKEKTAGFILYKRLIILVHNGGPALCIDKTSAAILDLGITVSDILNITQSTLVNIEDKFNGAVKKKFAIDMALNTDGSINYNGLTDDDDFANILRIQFHWELEAHVTLSKATGYTCSSNIGLIAYVIGDIDVNAFYIQALALRISYDVQMNVGIEKSVSWFLQIKVEGNSKLAQKYLATVQLDIKFGGDLSTVKFYSLDIPSTAIQVEICIITSGTFSISWRTKGKHNSKVTVSIGRNNTETWLTVFNTGTGWFLYTSTSGDKCLTSVDKKVALLFDGQYVAFVDSTNTAIVNVVTIIEFIKVHTEEKKIPSKDIIEACQTATADALVVVGNKYGVAKEISEKVFAAFGFIFKTQSKKLVGLSYVYTINYSTCIQICASTLSIKETVPTSHPPAIASVVTACSKVVLPDSGVVLGTGVALLQTTITASFSMNISVEGGGSLSFRK